MAPVNISDYSPEVELFQGIHGLPHLNGFHRVSNAFDITYETDDPLHNDYVGSVPPLSFHPLLSNRTTIARCTHLSMLNKQSFLKNLQRH